MRTVALQAPAVKLLPSNLSAKEPSGALFESHKRHPSQCKWVLLFQLIGLLLVSLNIQAEPVPLPPLLCSGSGTSCLSSESATSSGRIKWNPGHYVLPVGARQHDQNQAQRISGLYQEIGKIPGIKGVALRVPYGTLERDRKGNYQPGFEFLDAELAALAALPHPKRLWLRLDHVFFGANGDYADYQASPDYEYGDWDLTKAIPRYMRQAGLVEVSGKYGARVQWWNPVFADHLIDMIRAYGARYDGHPLFEGISIIKETAMGGTGGTYSGESLRIQLERVSAAAIAAFPKTNVVVNVNAEAGGSSRLQMVVNHTALGAGQGGPDIAPDCVVSDLECSAGFSNPQTSSMGAIHTITRDIAAGAVPVAYSIETSELGNNTVGQWGGYLPQTFMRYCNDWGLGCTHLFWHQQTKTSVDSRQQWSTPDGVRAFIAANPPLRYASCPRKHVERGGCVTGQR